MTTSAEQLNFILTQVNRRGKGKDRFLSVLAETLSFDGPSREILALHRIVGLLEQIEADISDLPADDEKKNNLRRRLQAFNGIKDISQAHMNMDNAKRHFMKPDNLMNLTEIHLDLSGRLERKELPRDTIELAEKFAELSFQIEESSLSHEAKISINVRMNQIISILRTSYAFSPQDLKVELDALMGAVMMNATESTETGHGIFKTLAAAVLVGYGLLAGVDKSLGHAISIHDRGQNLIDLLRDNDQ